MILLRRLAAQDIFLALDRIFHTKLTMLTEPWMQVLVEGLQSAAPASGNAIVCQGQSFASDRSKKHRCSLKNVIIGPKIAAYAEYALV